MKTRHYISFHVPRSASDRIRVLIRGVGCLDVWQEPHNERALPHLAHTFDSEEPRFVALMELLKREGIDWFERVEHIYTDAELRSFPLLHLRVLGAEISPDGLAHGTTFDLKTGCPDCGAGATQTSPVFAPPSAFSKKGLICASHTETFVAEPVADALRRGDVTGLELRQVISSRNHGPLPWWQIISLHEMPKMDARTRGVVRSESPSPCMTCGRDNHYDTASEPSQIVYRHETVNVEGLPDVVHTWERFGKSGIDLKEFKFSRFAPPFVLVKLKVFDIFRKLKVKHTCFEPVRIE